MWAWWALPSRVTLRKCAATRAGKIYFFTIRIPKRNITMTCTRRLVPVEEETRRARFPLFLPLDAMIIHYFNTSLYTLTKLTRHFCHVPREQRSTLDANPSFDAVQPDGEGRNSILAVVTLASAGGHRQKRVLYGTDP